MGRHFVETIVSDTDIGIVDVLVKLSDLSTQVSTIEASLKNIRTDWLPAAVGLASAGAALLVGWWNRQSARTQLKATQAAMKLQAEMSERVAVITAHDRLIAEKRIEWLETLRKSASQFNGRMAALINKAIGQTGSGVIVDISEDLNNLAETRFYFLLLLNPNEELHQKAAEAIEEYYLTYTQYPKINDLNKLKPVEQEKLKIAAIERYKNARVQFQEAVKRILKHEWDRTKSRGNIKPSGEN
ncbi:MAG: hypothetical protein ING29_12920 [Azospirillum sp.]|nr:hypothetical protein [Azospirillum sp.]